MDKDTRKYILVTDTFASLGFADEQITKHQESEVIIGYQFDKTNMEPKEAKERQELFDKTGEGIVETFRLDKLMKNRDEYRDWIWVWDGNHNVEENELLRSEGFDVVFGGEFCNSMENDREAGIEFAQSCGMEIPETTEFMGSDFNGGIKFLEDNEEDAFVFKPNNSQDNWLTYVPKNEDPINANLELREYMTAIEKTGKVKEGFVLQKKIKGVEVNVEVFVSKGKYVFAHANFENKRTHMNDTGEASGCAFDVDFAIPLNCKLVKETVNKFRDKLPPNFTGFVDANVFVGEYQQIFFLEYCFRVGYSMAPNFFYNLSEHTFLQFAADLHFGTYIPKVKDGFGASLTLFAPHYHMGLPIYCPDSLRNKFYLMEGYREDDKLFMTGLDHEIGVVMAHEYSIENALKNVVENGEKIIFPDVFARWDAYTNKDAVSGPKRRYEALMVMGMFKSVE